jgi:hypothetical protein
LQHWERNLSAQDLSVGALLTHATNSLGLTCFSVLGGATSAETKLAALHCPHQGRWCYGKTPMRTFIDTLPVAKEKLMQVLPEVSKNKAA